MSYLDEKIKPKHKPIDLSKFNPDNLQIKSRPPTWLNRKKTPTLSNDDEDKTIIEDYLKTTRDDIGKSCVNHQEKPTFTDSRIKVLENPLAGFRLTAEVEDIIIGAIRSYRAESDNITELVSATKVFKLYRGLPFFSSNLMMKTAAINKRQAQNYMKVIETANKLIINTKTTYSNLAQQYKGT